MSTQNHVRLKPYKPEAGQVKKTYNAPWGFTYREGVWYVEPTPLAEERCAYLRTVHMNSCDEYSPLAFNICTREEAQQIKLYEESGELEKVRQASRPIAPPAPTTEAAPAMSEDLNLPAPRSELAAAAAAAAVAREDARPSSPPAPQVAPVEPEAPAKAVDHPPPPKTDQKATRGRPKTRRKSPGK